MPPTTFGIITKDVKGGGRVSSAAFVCLFGDNQKKNPRPSWNVEIRFSPVVMPSTSLFLKEPL